MINKVFEKLLTYSMVQLISFGIVAGFIYYFTAFNSGSAERTQIETLTGQISSEEQKKLETEKVLAEERRMRDAIGELGQQYQELSRKIPKKLDSLELNRSIDTFARNANVSIKSRRPEALVQKEIIEEVPITVSLEGSFADLATFVFMVSKAERVASIKQFTIQAVDEKKPAVLRLDGMVVGYQLYEKKVEVDANGQPVPGGTAP